MSGDGSEICSLPMLETQLARSGKAPLEVIFDYEKLNDESDSAVPELALQTLARHSARWKALYITRSQCAHLASVQGAAAAPGEASVCGRDEEGTEDENSPPPAVNYFARAPRLRFIEVDDGFPFFEVPWAQLTGYEALGPWVGHITALRLLTNAESCNFTIAHEAHWRIHIIGEPESLSCQSSASSS
jgi:hypothetical protein